MKLRIASFNLENLDESARDRTVLDRRIEVLQPLLLKLDADILCLQEVHGQTGTDNRRSLKALDLLLLGTKYESYHRVYTQTERSKQVYGLRNLVILSAYPITYFAQYRNDFASAPHYKYITAEPADQTASSVRWERPILHAQIDLGLDRPLHVLNLHLKSRLPTPVEGQTIGRSKWRSASGWAEGYFVSSMKRVGQALEVRRFIDHIFDQDEQSLLLVCGDFNADVEDVPVMAICGDVAETRNPDLISRVMVPTERSLPPSQRFSFVYQGKGRMLDHILSSRALWRYHQHSEVHNELLQDESLKIGGDKLFPDSDHAPLIAEFLL
ncbi:MAG: endonuclease/exonuclease/phosphatase family protein [Gammaproteobacteria bacterium]|nr:endonuclease/exonuclease/phosphatase family protein [Gammaproteobacteria bacterium]